VAALAVIPFGDRLRIPFTEIETKLIVADIDAGVLWLFAMASLAVYGIILAGWSSDNHFSFLGGLRSSAQIISYEMGMSFAIISVLIVSGGLRLREVVAAQGSFGWHFWTMPLAFVIFFICIFAETNRLPFDLPEAESELVVGYHTEYSSMRFALFFMAEYVGMVTMSTLLVTLFFGGWKLPGLYWLLERAGFTAQPLHPIYGLADIAVFAAKVFAVLMFFIWVRWTLPRFRYDQLMALGWKVILPLSILQVLLAAVWKLFGSLPYAVCTAITLAVVVVVFSRPRVMPVVSRARLSGDR
jgi:NADH-quinone oxidoreductase subunit H